MEPKVAMLSFSTKGSAKHELVTKVQEATAQVHTNSRPNSLRRRTAGGRRAGGIRRPAQVLPAAPSPGHANVLVFPDLQSGNIGYKLVQRLAGAEAVGPIIQGLAKPVNDFTRGCSVEDIVTVVAITAVQAQG